MNHETHTTSQTDDPSIPLTLQEINRYIARGHRLRSQMVVGAISGLRRRLAASVSRKPDQPAIALEKVEPAANALAAIRSAVEILHDTPDLNPGERRRFTEIILREEKRLESMLNAFRRRAI